MSNTGFSDKVVIVTGAGTGIGGGIAARFAKEGARVVATTSRRKTVEPTVERISQSGGEAVSFVTDLSRQEAPGELVDTAIESYGRLDIVVHNAAYMGQLPLDQFDEAELHNAMAVNIAAGFRLTQAASPHMKRQKGGRFLFTLTTTGPRVVVPGSAIYATTKTAMEGFIRSAAIELAPHGITVNGVIPGYIATPHLMSALGNEGKATLEKMIPMGYMGEPDDIAHAMLFLASDEARYITGTTILVDGGSILPQSISHLPGFG